MPPVSRGKRGGDVKQRILVSLVLTIGLVLCLVNALYLVHILVDVPSSNVLVQERIKVPSATLGKERLLHPLDNAGIHNISQQQLQQLPTWKDVVNLYGDTPKLVGMETCQTFQQAVPSAERLLAPAGIFNSGTNLLAELLLKNCVLQQRKRKHRGNGIRWQVNWGKHQPPRFRLNHSVDASIQNNAHIMPVVMIRDPYSWMQSMCRHRYSAHWFHPPQHCPNLVPDREDFQFLQYAPHYKTQRRFWQYHRNDPWLVDNVMNTANFLPNHTVVPLYVRYKLINTTHTSLAHLWNDWYTEYMHGDFPRIFVRMEDLVFHAETVVRQVCTCVGGTPAKTFRYITESAKHGDIHGNDKTTLLDAMIRYGSSSKLNRTKGMTQDDVAYAKKVLRRDFMDMFGYSHPT